MLVAHCGTPLSLIQAAGPLTEFRCWLRTHAGKLQGMTRLSAVARGTAYAGGLLGAGHWLHHCDTLAVVMFHRITALGGADAAAADPDYSLSAPLFTACLIFLQRHYNVVGLGQLRESLRGGRHLPPYSSLLITFVSLRCGPLFRGRPG